ncbi:MAG: LytTR family transcriptional regulator [Cytophagaceae bacterium]|nr:LytTR family transcriptional regulator [Cytophagaceae bacterium]MBK9933252.1 LytTR family transcriptional regulator [Cytophagaceae bacterium]MBL0303034.1 LytTR family transcriptional regulator [Cytophagaceae bacterium]MBL0323572.1 LytTR family transcriptional regulator [Cytophagaceae bacterium]
MKNKPRQSHLLLIENAENDVIKLEGIQNYTKFVFENGSYIMMSYTLKNYQNFLKFPFVRVSKSFIVNLNFCSDFSPGTKKLWVSDGSEIQISRRRLTEVSVNLEKLWLV